jgi:hypothetical protein
MVDGTYRRPPTPNLAAAGVPLRLRAVVRLIDAAAQLALLALDTRATVHRWTRRRG